MLRRRKPPLFSLRKIMNWVILLCKTFGGKCHEDKDIADRCCYFRLFWYAMEMIAMVAIIANAIHQW